jgi:hypothetical protein
MTHSSFWNKAPAASTFAKTKFLRFWFPVSGFAFWGNSQAYWPNDRPITLKPETHFSKFSNLLLMKQVLKLILVFGISITCFAPLQAQECLTQPTPEQIAHLTQTRQARQSFDINLVPEDRSGPPLHWIPVQFQECLLNSSSWPALYESDIANWMSDLNEIFRPYRIQFFECGTRTTFVSSTLNNFDISEEPQLSAYDIPNVINIYVFGTVNNGSSSYGGYSYLPPSVDRIVLSKANGNLFDSKVFIHEMGHYLGLYHTHGKTNSGITDELVNGSNCQTAGDDVCDTPADPNLLNSSSMSCTYTGTALDANQQPYAPDVHNHMSYAFRSCRNQFSVGQLNRMAYTALHDRVYLIGCSHPAGCEFPITDLPSLFDFESGTMEGWTNRYYEEFESASFVNGSGATPTLNTGPDQAYSGTHYLYLDAAQSNIQNSYGVGALISPCFDLRGQESPKLRLSYHAYGSDIDQFAVQVSFDGGYTFNGNDLLIMSGEQGNTWHTATFDLTPYKDHPSIQFRIASGIYGSLADFAVDSIVVYNTPNTCNLSLTPETLHISCHNESDGVLNISPSGSFVPPVSYLWSNGATTNLLSNLSQGLYTVTATSANGCTAVATLPVLNPSYLYTTTTQTNVQVYGQSTGSATAAGMGGVAPYQYQWSNGGTTATINNLAIGVYTVTVTDAYLCTTTKAVIITQPPVSCSSYFNTYPWANSIEQNLGIFEQVTGSDFFNWTRQSGGTPTAQTGPDAAYHGGRYWYARASGGNSPNKTARLKTTPCLQLSSLSNPVFEFYYHLYGNQMGSLAIEVSLDNEATWTTVWTKSGNQGNQWYKGSVSLLPYRNENLKLRITATTGSGARSDIAIDALYIGEAGGNQYLPESTGFTAPVLTVFPNPSAGLFELQLESDLQAEQVEIYNAAGQLIWQERVTSQRLNFDLRTELPGIYYLRVYGADWAEVLKLMVL